VTHRRRYEFFQGKAASKFAYKLTFKPFENMFADGSGVESSGIEIQMTPQTVIIIFSFVAYFPYYEKIKLGL
jgi:hypothetical protein